MLLLIDIGLNGIGSVRSGSFTADPFGALAALGTLFLAGLIYGVLVMARLSPFGPGFAGLALMGASSWAVLDPSSYSETLGTINAMDGAIGQMGLGMLLGAPLIATLTSPRRWRNGKNGEGDQDNADTVPSTQPSILSPTRLTPSLPTYKTLRDVAWARPAAPASESTVVPPLPRRIPMTPPAMRGEDPENPWPDSPTAAPGESSASPSLDAAPTENLATSGPATAAGQEQTDWSEQRRDHPGA